MLFEPLKEKRHNKKKIQYKTKINKYFVPNYIDVF